MFCSVMCSSEKKVSLKSLLCFNGLLSYLPDLKPEKIYIFSPLGEDYVLKINKIAKYK